MSKKGYVSIDGIARKIKDMYYGVKTDVPVYEDRIDSTMSRIQPDNIEKYFTVTNGTYTFEYLDLNDNNGYDWRSTNYQINSSTAEMTLTAKKDCKITGLIWEVSSESNYDKFTITINGVTKVNALSGVQNGVIVEKWNYSDGSIDIDKGQTIVFKYVKDSSQHTNDDRARFTLMMQSRTTEKVLVRTDVLDIARRIKKAYFSLGGIARQFWNAYEPQLTKYGTVKTSGARPFAASTSLDGSMIIAGGIRSTTTLGTISKCDSSMTFIDNSSTLAFNGGALAATSMGDYAFFGGGGGISSDGITQSSVVSSVTTVNTSFTRGTVSGGMTLPMCFLSAASLDNCFFFGCGCKNTSGDNTYTIDGFNQSFTKTTIMNENSANGAQGAAARAGSYVYFVGGYSRFENNGANTGNYGETFDSSLSSRSRMQRLSERKRLLATAEINNCAIFAGGQTDNTTSPTYCASVDMVNASGTWARIADLSIARDALAGTTIYDESGEHPFAVFAGGRGNDMELSTKSIDIYDSSFTKVHTDLQLSNFSQFLTASTVGDKYGVFTAGFVTKTNNTICPRQINIDITWGFDSSCDVFTII